MNSKAALVCPNCFGSEQRKVLATATSRNVADDYSLPQRPQKTRPTPGKRDNKVVKTFCSRCGYELHSKGNRG